MNFLTNFGDLTVLLPLSAVMLIWLLSLQLRSSAIWWVVALALCVCLTVLLKIYLYVCQPSTELHSPSGHTSLSTLVYGAIAFVVAAECGHWRRYFAIVIGLGLIASIGLSRVALGAFLRAASEMRDHGTFSSADDAVAYGDLNQMFE